MGEGDLAARADVGGGAELARLGSSFNRLASSLEREDELRRAAAADIAHELRTPVTGIVARIEAAQDGVMADPEANLAAMHEEALRLARLIEDVSQLAEAEKPELLVEKTRVDLGVGRPPARRRAGRLLPRQGHRLRARRAPGRRLRRREPARADRRQPAVQRAALHRRRRQRAPERAPRRAPTPSSRSPTPGSASRPRSCSRVFDRFWRSDRSRSRATGGSGIGLAVVRELVEAHGGDVDVESAPGRGTLFRVSLPALRQERVQVPVMGRALVSAAQ